MSVEDDQKLFVAGLADAATEEGLRTLFESAGGSVSEITVPRDRASGKARGFAFVTMGSEDDARLVRQRLDGSNYEGRPLSVRAFRADRGAPGAARPGAQRDARGPDGRGFESRSSEHRAFDAGPRSQGGSGQGSGSGSGSGYSGSGSGSSGAGYSASGSSGSGYSASSQSGSGYSASGSSGGYNRSGSSGADHGAVGGGSSNSGAGYRSQGGASQGAAAEDSTLYVGNLPFDCTSVELEQLFSERGFVTVRRVHLPMDPEGRARGFGFVALDSADNARRAVDQLQDAAVRGRRLSISVARARGAPGGGSGNYPRVGGPPSAGARPAGGSGSYAAAPHQSGPRYDGPPSFGGAPSFGGPPSPSAEDEARRQGKWAGGDKDKDKDKDKKKDKKRKAKAAPAADRGVKRRRDDDFRSTRAQDYVDDWDDD